MRTPQASFSLQAIVAIAGCLLLSGHVLAYITDCSKPIMIEEFKVKDVTFVEAVELLRAKTRDLDPTQPDPERKGVNIVFQGVTEEQKKKKVSLELQIVPAAFVLESLAKMVGLQMRVDAHAVVLLPKEANQALQTRIYRVPPDFLTQKAK